AGALEAGAHGERAERAVDVDAPGVARAPRQQVAAVGVVAAVRVVARPVARIGVAELDGQVPAGHGGVDGQLHAADPRLVDVVGQEDRRVVGDQVVDAGLVGVERPAVALRVARKAEVVSLRLLGPQVGLAEERVVQVIEGRRLEAGGVVGGKTVVVGEGQAPADAAGDVAAELFVVVVAHAGLQPVRAEVALVFGEHAGVVALGDGECRGAFHRVALPVGAGAEQVARVEPDVGLQRGGLAAGVEVADAGAAAGVVVEGVLGAVVVAAQLRGDVDAVVRRPGQLRAQHLLHVLGDVAAARAAVDLVARLRAQRIALQFQRPAQSHAAAQVDRAVAVAVAVGLVDEAAGAERRTGRGSGAAAGVDAVGALVRQVDAEPAALAAAADAGAGLAQAVAADAQPHARRERAVVAAGEDLDHAADRFRAVQARARTAHDLDAVDLVDRQVLERSQPGADRAHAHAVDQHQHLVGLGAAHEHVAQLAVAALVADVDAGAAAQQVGEAARLAAHDLVVVDDLGREQAVGQRDPGAGGGDHHFVQVGGRGAFGHGDRGGGQDAGDGQREDSGLHRDASPFARTHARETRVEARTTRAGPRGSRAAARVHVPAAKRSHPLATRRAVAAESASGTRRHRRRDALRIAIGQGRWTLAPWPVSGLASGSRR